MKLAGHRVVIVMLLILISSLFQIYGQISETCIPLEREADSLASVEKHREAVEIYKSITDLYAGKFEDYDRMRLDYKTGFSLMHSGHDIQAMPYFKRIIAFGEADSPDNLVNDAMTCLGKTYEYTGKHDSAFYWYMEAYKQVGESTDTVRRARNARNMAQLLRVLKRFNEARFYCQKAIDLIPGIDDFKVVANIYNETAYLFELSDNLDSAAYYYKQLINLSITNGYLKGESVGYSNLASVYDKQKSFAEALRLKQKGVEIERGIDNTYGLMVSYRGLSSIYFHSGNFSKALENLNIAQDLCDTTWLPDLSGIMFGFYEIFKARGQLAKSLEYYERYVRLQERINQAESKKHVDELLARYETEKKEQQIELLKQANLLKENKINMQWIVIGALTLLGIFIIVISLLWVRNKNQMLKQMNSELQHFIIRQEHLEGVSGEDNLIPEPGEIYKRWGLTSRESEILYYLKIGYTNALIGEKLFISENTVKFHIKNIYLKLDVKTRIQALLRCTGNNSVIA